MKKQRPVLQVMAIGLILCLSIVTSIRNSVIGYIIIPLLLLLFVTIMPVCRKRENLWMFFLVAVCSVPINLSLISRYVFIEGKLMRLILHPIAFFLFLCVEEVIMGYITRTIWKRQYKLS